MASINTDPVDNRRRLRRMTLAVWRSPLARSADRTQAGLLILAVTLWLLTLPVVAAAASIVWSGVGRAATTQQQTRTAATAQLLADVPDFYYASEYGTPVTPTVSTNAQWSGPDGRIHTGLVDATSGARTGDQQTVWMDSAGELADPPISTATAAVLTIGATAGAWLAWGLLLLLAWLTVRWRLNKRRSLDWETEWATTEPVWSGR